MRRFLFNIMDSGSQLSQGGRSFYKFRGDFVVFVISVFLSTAGLASPASDLVRTLNNTHTIMADFKQMILNGDGEVINESSGRLWLSKPNKFRWSVEKPMQQLVIANEKTIWNYEPDLRQVTISPVRSGIQATPLAILSGDPQALIENFSIEKKAKDYFLLAKRKNSFSKIVLSLQGNIIQQMLLYDNMGEETRVELTHVQLNQTLHPGLFTFP